MFPSPVGTRSFTLEVDRASSMRVWLVALVVLAAPLTGCLGGDEAAQGADQRLDRATVTDKTGGIEGVVTDPAVQPVEGADVTLVEANRSSTTQADGSYAISSVEPGEHTLRVTADGFLSQETTVDVVAGSVEAIDLILPHRRLAEPFQQTIELNGFIECGLGWQQEAAPAPRQEARDSALAACAIPNLFLPGSNATNDRFLHTLELEPPLTEVVYELDWEPGSTPATAPPLRTILEVQGFINQPGSRIMDERGPSPIRVELTEDDWQRLEQNFTDRCRVENGTTEDEDYCGVNFRGNGWPMVLRVFATGGCFMTPASACAVVQQAFTHVVSAFYHQQAPAGYTVTDA